MKDLPKELFYKFS